MSSLPHLTVATPAAWDDTSCAPGAIAVVTAPPAACPGCLAAAGDPWPAGATSRHCSRCLNNIRRVYQVQRWNADPAHQAMAGRASWSAFSAEHVRRYVTADRIRGLLGIPLPAPLQGKISHAWCAGILEPAAAWCADDLPPDPDGLWAAMHVSAPMPSEEVSHG